MNALRIRDGLPAWLRDAGRGRFAGAAILAGVLALGVILADDFGESWDEQNTARLGRATLQSYETGIRYSSELGDLARHGPAAAALVELGVDLLAALNPERPVYAIRHLLFFLFFVGGLACVYSLARRWMRPGPALMAVALLGSQPLLFGHAFINPNDTPFMSLFSATLLSGLTLADQLGRPPAPELGEDAGLGSLWGELQAVWNKVPRSKKAGFLFWLVLLLAVALDVLWLHRVILPLLKGWLEVAYSGEAWRPLNALFRWVAEDAWKTPLPTYEAKLLRAYFLLRWVLLALLAVTGLGLFRHLLLPLRRAVARLTTFRQAVLSGLVLGVTSAVRLVGPMAGLMVSAVALARGRSRAPGALLVYWITAAVSLYLLWPGLWGSAWNWYRAYLERTLFYSPRILVLFNGETLPATAMPWNYLATFLVLQTTLPALALGVLGMALSFLSRRTARIETLMLAIWLFLPIASASALHSTAYDNGRHFLFVHPALYLFSGLGIQEAWRRVSPLWIRGGIAVVVLAPAIAGIIRLHPYEYVYFNEIAGGVTGAFRRYELDYWGTACREAVEFVNQTASPGAFVITNCPSHLFASSRRDDLREYFRIDPPRNPTSEFAVSMTRSNWDLEYYSEAPIAYRVEVDGAVLAVVRDLREPSP